MEDQGISIESPQSRVLRLALVVLGAVLGLLVLGVVFGSSSASAAERDDSPGSLGSALGGVVSSVTEPVGQSVTAVSHAIQPATKPVAKPVAQAPAVKAVTDAVASVAPTAPVAAVTAPVSALVDGVLTKILGDSPLGSAIGPQPVGSVLDPIAQLLDGTVADAGDAVAAPVATPPFVAAIASATPAAAAAPALLAHVAISGFAGGTVLPDSGAAAGGTGVVGLSSAGSPAFAALSGAAFLVLLLVRRTTLADRDMPGSPVFDTDSSPD